MKFTITLNVLRTCIKIPICNNRGQSKIENRKIWFSIASTVGRVGPVKKIIRADKLLRCISIVCLSFSLREKWGPEQNHVTRGHRTDIPLEIKQR